MKKFAKVMALVMVAVMSLALLVSCAPNADPDKAVAALKKNGYTAAKVPAVLGVGGLETTVTGTKTTEDKDGNKKVETVTIMYYGSAEQAQKAYDNVKSENEKKDESDWTVAQSGKMIYFGTSAAIKAAR